MYLFRFTFYICLFSSLLSGLAFATVPTESDGNHYNGDPDQPIVNVIKVFCSQAEAEQAADPPANLNGAGQTPYNCWKYIRYKSGTVTKYTYWFPAYTSDLSDYCCTDYTSAGCSFSECGGCSPSSFSLSVSGSGTVSGTACEKTVTGPGGWTSATPDPNDNDPCACAVSVSSAPPNGYVSQWSCSSGSEYCTISENSISCNIGDDDGGETASCSVSFVPDDSRCTITFQAVGKGFVNGQTSGTINQCSASLTATGDGGTFSLWSYPDNSACWNASESGASISLSNKDPGGDCTTIKVSAFFSPGIPVQEDYCYIPLTLKCDGNIIYQVLEHQDGTKKAFGSSDDMTEYTLNPSTYKQNHNYTNCDLAEVSRPADPVTHPTWYGGQTTINEELWNKNCNEITDQVCYDSDGKISGSGDVCLSSTDVVSEQRDTDGDGDPDITDPDDDGDTIPDTEDDDDDGDGIPDSEDPDHPDNAGEGDTCMTCEEAKLGKSDLETLASNDGVKSKLSGFGVTDYTEEEKLAIENRKNLVAGNKVAEDGTVEENIPEIIDYGLKPQIQASSGECSFRLNLSSGSYTLNMCDYQSDFEMAGDTLYALALIVSILIVLAA